MQFKCSEEKRQYYKQRREELKTKGLCVTCGAEPVETGTMCDGCKDKKKAGRDLNKVREYSAKARARRKALGLCNLCLEPAVDGTRFCERHRKSKVEYNRRYYQKTPGRVIKALRPTTLEPIEVDFSKPPWFLSFNCEATPTVFEMGVQ